jgi:hypothetical protein
VCANSGIEAFDACYRAMSYEFRVQSTLPGPSAILDRLFASFRIRRSNGVPTYRLSQLAGERPRYALYIDGEQVLEADRVGSAIDLLISETTMSAIKAASDYVMVHAGAVSWKGRGILLPAPEDSGKSTLTAGLTMDGYSFYTDEAAPIDFKDGRLHPFPRPIALEPEGLDVVKGLRERLPREYHDHYHYRYHVTPEDLGGATGRTCDIGFVVAPSYRSGAETELVPMSRPEALMTLATNSFNLDRAGGAVLEVLKGVVEEADCYRLFIGDLDVAIQKVERLVAGS